MDRKFYAALRAGLVTFLFLSLSQAASAQQQLGTGLKKEDPATMRSFPHSLRFRGYLPPEADLSSRMPEPGYQGLQGSCVGWAVGYAVRSYYDGARNQWDFRDPKHLFSPAFVYNQLATTGTCLEGVTISAGLKLLQQEGIATLEEFPYDVRKCSIEPAANLKEAAKANRINGFHTVDTKTVDDVKAELKSGRPVIIGIEVPKDFLFFSGDQNFDVPSAAGPTDIGHAMVIVGYNDARQALRVLNSWGKDWGDHGYAWISYPTFTARALSAFVIDMPVPPPPPEPVPASIVAEVKPSPPPPPAPLPVVVASTLPDTPAPKPAPIAVAPSPSPSPSPSPAPSPVAVTPPPARTERTLPPPPAPKSPSTVRPPAPPKPPTPAVTPTPPAPGPHLIDAPVLRWLAEQQFKSFECASLHDSVKTGQKLGVSGFVASNADKARLEEQLHDAAGPQLGPMDVAVKPWPLCEAMLTFDRPVAAARGLHVSIDGATNASEPIVLAEDAPLVINVTSPSFASYLDVSYLQANGDVIHLYHQDNRKPVPPHTKLTFGKAKDKATFRIGPPFGNEMIIAIAAAEPLATDTPETQTEREYLTQFRIAYLEATRNRADKTTVAAAIQPLVTQQR